MRRNSGQNLFIKKQNVMEITGRLVADATVRTVSEDRIVTGFRVAVNRSYKAQGERKEETAYVDCSYWRTDAIAPYLIEGMIVLLHGFMTAEPWVNHEGEPMASLKFRTDEITMLSKAVKRDAENNSKTPGQAGDKNKVLKPSEQFN
jgi:single-strand DNA-binding protein